MLRKMKSYYLSNNFFFLIKFKAQGGDSIVQRLKRIVFDAKSTIVVSCDSSVSLIIP